MEENSTENSQKIPTNLVSKEERYLRMFFTYIRLKGDKIESKHRLENIMLKDKKAYDENLEKLKDDWITIYYNIYDYFISKEDNIYTYFYDNLIYLTNEENEKAKELKYIVISIMKICLKICPPTREDIINFYQLFRLKNLDQNIFSLLMEIFEIIYSNNNSTSFKEYFSNFESKEFYLFDGNSHIEIKLDKDWINSAFASNPDNNRSKAYYVLGFSFRYYKKYENSKLVQIRFPSNKYLVFTIKNGLFNCNLPFKDKAQIPILENKDYSISMAFLKERIQIHVNDTFYETTEGIEETAKNLIVGDKFFGLFYKIYSTFSFEPLTFNNGVISFIHPEAGHGDFHTFFVETYHAFESITHPKKLTFKNKSYKINVKYSERVFILNTERTYMRSLKNYGEFGSFIMLIMFFIYKPEFYKKEYINLILDKLYENCLNSKENEKLFCNNNYLAQICIILCNFPKNIRNLEFIEHLRPLTKYSSYYNYYLDILKLVYGYEPEKNKQPFSFHLINVMIKKMEKVEKIEQLNEIRDILLETLKHYYPDIDSKKENAAEEIYNLILIYFQSFKSPNNDLYFYVPNYFWFITLYIFFFELKKKIKEVEKIYNQIKENINESEYNSDNEYIVKLLNYYILKYNNDKIDFIFYPKEEKNFNNHIYIYYIFKLYARFKKDKNYEDLINNNIKDVKMIFSKYNFKSIDDYKDTKILNFLIPCVYNLPCITHSFKKDENSSILELLCEDLFQNETKEKILFDFIKLLKNICINIKFTDTNSNGYLIHFLKKEINKQLKKYNFEVQNSFYNIFEDDLENAKSLSIDISNFFGELYSKLSEDKKKDIIDHEISSDKLKEYFDTSSDLYVKEDSISYSNLEQILFSMNTRKDWIRTTQNEQFFYNQNWSDFDFCYNPDNKNAKFSVKGVGTNDLKFPYLYRVPDITKVIKRRNKKGIPDDKISDLFKEEVIEPFPICVHLSTKEIKKELDFILKYHGSINLQTEKEYIIDNRKKYPCCLIGSILGKGFFYVKDENTIEYQNYYELENTDNYNCLDKLDGIYTDKRHFFNPVKIFQITIKKENIKMFFKRINYYDDQGLEIYLYLGGSWYFVFKENRDQFLEEAGMTLKENNEKPKKDKKEKKTNETNSYIFDADWRKKYLFNTIYNDLNYKSGLFGKSKIFEPIGYISKYFRFPGDNKYWENPCVSDVLNKWKNHEISTYTLLIYLNIFSGRSNEDKNQNIIMPLLILLNQENKISLRNLKLPLGQQTLENNADNSKRISYFDNLYKNEKSKNKAYFYPISISTQKNCYKNLSSMIPFNQICKSLYNDKNNYLMSLKKEIIDSLTNVNNINEAIPDFFVLSEYFTNINHLKDLKNDEIELPICNLINNNNYNFDKSLIFTLTLNKILESKEVNDTIGNWIDLVFGCDQHSEKLKNIYKPECYLNDKSQVEIFKNDKQILDNLPLVGVLPYQLIKSTKFNSLVTRKCIPLNLNFPIKETISVKLGDFELTEMLNFAALNSEIFIFFGESKIWNINSKNIKNNQIVEKYSLDNKTGVIKELFNPKYFKKIFAISRLHKYSVQAGNIDDVITFYNHAKLDRAYHDFCKNKNVITAIEILDYVGYEHYLLIGKKNGHIHHYKIDFETIDDYIRYYDETQFPGYFYKSILRYHSKEVVSIKYNPYLNLWISSSKDGFVHIFNYNGDPILSTCIKNKNIKYAILASDPIPCFVVYFDNEFNCYLINQVKPIRKLNLKSELYNFDIIKSNGFEDYLICQDENKIYIISLPYLEIVYEINEKVTSFDYLPNEKLIIGFFRHEDESKVTIKKIKCDI